MQILELHFNDKSKEDNFFYSSAYEPRQIYEKKLGALYLVGELKNGPPSNNRLLDSLASVIKKRYYALSNRSQEKSISESLKNANQFLSEEVKKDNVSWLGNMNAAFLSIKDFNLIFSKTGDIKIFLFRSGEITDIGKNLDNQEIEPYPLKVFFNIVSGKLIKDDTVAVFTKEIYNFFLKENLLKKISQLDLMNEKKIKEMLAPYLAKENGIKIPGICLLAVLSDDPEAKGQKEIFFQEEEKFSFAAIFSPLAKPLKFIKKKIGFLGKISDMFKGSKTPPRRQAGRRPVKSNQRRKQIEKARFKFPSIAELKKLIENPVHKRNIILILIMIAFLSFGFLIFQSRKGDVIENIPTTSENNSAAAENEAVNLQNINLVYEISPGETNFNPQKILLAGENIYLHEPATSKIYRVNLKEKTGNFVPQNPNFNLAAALDDSILVYLKPDTVFLAQNEKWQEVKIQAVPGTEFSQLSSYSSNLYFLDSQKCEVVRYLYKKSEWISPQNITVKKDNHSCPGAKAMAIDGYVWILNQDNSIDGYYKGVFQKTISLNVSPSVKNITKIETQTDIPYLYLLEPEGKRLIIVAKDGQFVRQIENEILGNSKDIAVSADGKIIWILSGLKIYQILQSL